MTPRTIGEEGPEGRYAFLHLSFQALQRIIRYLQHSLPLTASYETEKAYTALLKPLAQATIKTSTYALSRCMRWPPLGPILLSKGNTKSSISSLSQAAMKTGQVRRVAEEALEALYAQLWSDPASLIRMGREVQPDYTRYCWQQGLLALLAPCYLPLSALRWAAVCRAYPPRGGVGGF